MKEFPKITVNLLTYNRKNEVTKTLEYIRQWDYPKDCIEIVVIDNASTDKTPEMLREHNYLKEVPPYGINDIWQTSWQRRSCYIFYLRIPENTGGAGGFYHGTKFAFERGFDWLWLMDDDVEPLPNALENQFKYSRLSKCIHPSRCLDNGARFSWGQVIDKEGRNHPINDIKIFEHSDFVEVNTGCFEGMLIHRDVISRIGFPEKKFFMVGDDTLYGWLASHHTKVLYIRDFCFKKKLPVKKGKSPLGEYLYFRNNYYLLKIFTGDSLKLKILYSFKVFTKILSRLFKYRSRKLALAVMKGYIDGIRGDFSNVYIKRLLLNK